jgi:hypothetical protein
MLFNTLLIIHVCAATIGILAGFFAMAVRKGSGLHNAAGMVFFVSMLAMSSTGAYIAAFLHPVAANVVAALLTMYLVTTAWRAARVKQLRVNAFDVAAMMFILAVGLGSLRVGLSGKHDRMPVAIYFIFGTIALLFAVSDVRLIVRGGISGARRLGRHLWRMSLALLLATFSFYPGQARLFSKALRETNLLFLPHLLLLAAVLIWLARVSKHKKVERAIA